MYSSKAWADDEVEKVLGPLFNLVWVTTTCRQKKKKMRLHNDHEIASFEQKWVVGWAAGRTGCIELHAPRDVSPFRGSCPAPD